VSRVKLGQPNASRSLERIEGWAGQGLGGAAAGVRARKLPGHAGASARPSPRPWAKSTDAASSPRTARPPKSWQTAWPARCSLSGFSLHRGCRASGRRSGLPVHRRHARGRGPEQTGRLTMSVLLMRPQMWVAALCRFSLRLVNQRPAQQTNKRIPHDQRAIDRRHCKSLNDLMRAWGCAEHRARVSSHHSTSVPAMVCEVVLRDPEEL
jgi:hypothetical protein